jgi:hypothetical protein
MSLADPTWQETLGGLVTAVLIIGGGIAGYKKTRSSDSVEIAKDRAEVDILAVVRAERDEARAEAKSLREQRTKDVETIARLEVESGAHISDESRLAAQNHKLRRNMQRMAEGLPPELREAWQQALMTDFAPLGASERTDER